MNAHDPILVGAFVLFAAVVFLAALKGSSRGPGNKRPRVVKQGRCAVYWIEGRWGRVIYVGMSVNPDKRLLQHKADKPWANEIRGMRVQWFETRQAAQRCEQQAIKSLHPKYNVAGIYTPFDQEIVR